MGRKKKQEEPQGEAGWMATFADLSTLLLTFFVLLLSMSSLDEQTIKTAFQHFTDASGVLYFKKYSQVQIVPNLKLETIINSLEGSHILDVREIEDESPEDIANQDFNLLVASGAAVWVRREENQITLIFGNKLLFDSGSYELKPASFSVLDRIGEYLKYTDYQTYIDGHADDKPVSGDGFESNQQLSTLRAMAILNYIHGKFHVDLSRICVGGYGSLAPLADNNSEAGRALNRRVEITFREKG